MSLLSKVIRKRKNGQKKQEQVSELMIHVAIIDKSLIWYGSVNYLGYNTDENNAIRIYDSTLAEDIIEMLYT